MIRSWRCFNLRFYSWCLVGLVLAAVVPGAWSDFEAAPGAVGLRRGSGVPPVTEIEITEELSGVDSKGLPVLDDLSPYNPVLRKLRAEIARNLRSTARRGELDRPLRFVRYTVREDDNFFTIMAKVSQSPDTLASVNELLNPNALVPGQVLLIPNARGLFIRGSSPTKVAREYRTDVQNLVVQDDRIFLPGGFFGAIQLQYFKGEGFLQPLKTGRISSRFGMRRDPFTRRATFHGGLDIAAPKGTPVYASRDGVVGHAGKAGGYGKLIILDHKFDYQTYYGHLSSVQVRPGDKVRAGQLIGRVGATGRATGNHLHFELRKKGVRKKPTFIHRAGSLESK